MVCVMEKPQPLYRKVVCPVCPSFLSGKTPDLSSSNDANFLFTISSRSYPPSPLQTPTPCNPPPPPETVTSMFF